MRDDGGGIDLDRLRARAVEMGLLHADLAADLTPAQAAALLFQPGLSTAAAVTEVSGRGVGMDAVRTTVESLGGSVEIETQRGRGTITRLRVPVTAAVQRVLLVSVSGETLALPIAKVERILEQNLWDLYFALPQGSREKFKAEGENAAATLRAAIEGKKVKPNQVLNAVHKWLKTIPRVNPYFLEQEAKIKTDQVMALVHERRKEEGLE